MKVNGMCGSSLVVKVCLSTYSTLIFSFMKSQYLLSREVTGMFLCKYRGCVDIRSRIILMIYPVQTQNL